MRYRTNATPEHVRPMGVKDTIKELKSLNDDALKQVDSILGGLNCLQIQRDSLYRQGARSGFVYGLVIGAFVIALLAVVVLGDVLGG